MCCVHEYMVQKAGVLGADMKYKVVGKAVPWLSEMGA